MRTFIWSLLETLKLRNLSFLGSDQIDDLLKNLTYDGDGFRAEIVNRVIPNKSNRVTLHSFSKRAYKGRNVVDRCFCRLKDFRRVATRYDKFAGNFLAAVHLAAIVAYWIN